MEHFVTSRPELEPIVDLINKKLNQKGYCSLDDLIGNGDTTHGYVFSNQKEADKAIEAFRVIFPKEK